MKPFKFFTSFQGYVAREYNDYDNYVEYEIKEHLDMGISWRGFETLYEDENREFVKLKIISGINLGGLLRVMYLITKNVGCENETTTHHTVSIELNQIE